MSVSVNVPRPLGLMPLLSRTNRANGANRTQVSLVLSVSVNVPRPLGLMPLLSRTKGGTRTQVSLVLCVCCGCERTETFGADATALQRVHGPVVVLERVHELQDGADPADGGVDGGGADELGGQVGVEGQLDLENQGEDQTHEQVKHTDFNPDDSAAGKQTRQCLLCVILDVSVPLNLQPDPRSCFHFLTFKEGISLCSFPSSLLLFPFPSFIFLQPGLLTARSSQISELIKATAMLRTSLGEAARFKRMKLAAGCDRTRSHHSSAGRQRLS